MIVRVIYENGVLRPLYPVELNEGQEFEVTIAEPVPLTREEAIRRLQAAGILVDPDDILDPDEEAFEISDEDLERIGQLMALDRPIEDEIREMRGKY